MPQNLQDQTVYLSTGDPETYGIAIAVTTPYKPGELGKRFIASTGKRYQLVQLDSSSSTTAANQLVFWAQRTLYTVTAAVADTRNVALQNGVAGRAPGIVAASGYFAMQIGGSAVISYAGTTTNGAVGAAVIAATANTLGQANAIAIGTAPTNKVVGWVTTAATTTQVTCSMCLDDGEVM
jgi:hypothetical protein